MAEQPPTNIQYYFQEPLNKFVQRIVNAWYRHPFQVTSWWRSVAHNREVGGAQFSQHLVGLAIDATSPNLAQLDQAFKAEGLKTIPYATHVHAQLWEAGKLERELAKIWGLS